MTSRDDRGWFQENVHMVRPLQVTAQRGGFSLMFLEPRHGMKKKGVALNNMLNEKWVLAKMSPRPGLCSSWHDGDKRMGSTKCLQGEASHRMA